MITLNVQAQVLVHTVTSLSPALSRPSALAGLSNISCM